MRAVLDVNVIVSAVLSPDGAPASALRAWTDGAFEMVTSPKLLTELRQVLRYPKFRTHIDAEEGEALVELLRRGSIVSPDPEEPPSVNSVDPDDDYLISLAEATRSVLVTGDADLLGLADRIPVFTPAGFLRELILE